ncbi:MAG TPA: PH domain-containing protein [Microthrixaceae bacterium]|nr:PH domain-containing protein [Microthrixaceae bacterium]
MAFPRAHLNQNEEVVIEMHPHWWFLVPRGILLFAGLVFGGFALGVGDGSVSTSEEALRWFAVAVVVVTLLVFVARLIQYVSTDFVVTNERCIYRSGVFAKRGVEIPLDRINTVFFNQSIFERLIRAGDIGIESAGENSRQEFSDIYNPVFVQTTIYREMEEYENRRQDRLGKVMHGHGHAASASAPSSLTVAEQLEKLHQLKAQGALTEQEYDAQKAKLLGS